MVRSPARTFISYVAGLIAAFLIVLSNFNNQDPFIFGIYALIAFIVCSSVTWLLTGILFESISKPKEVILVDDKLSNGQIIDVTIGEKAESAGGKKPEQGNTDKLLDTLKSNGSVDWQNLSPVAEEDDLLLKEFPSPEALSEGENEPSITK